MDEYVKIKASILSKLIRKRMWQHKHTNIHNLPKGLPDNLRNPKLIKNVISDLLKKGFLLSKPTEYGLEISLNIKKKKGIEEFIGKLSK